MSQQTPLIPTRWTVDEAIAVHDFLHALLDALWDIHGDALARRCRELVAAEWPDCDDPVSDEDDIPFSTNP